MIRLVRPPPPAELTEELRKELTLEFKQSGKAGWNRPPIRAALREMSHGKCAFCECKLEEESKYLEVEHFAHKHRYQDKVVDWENLLPACRRCNGQKSDHDVLITPIINPAHEDPRDHLRFRLYRFDGSTDKGRATVSVLNLNDYQRLMLSRLKAGDAVLRQLDEIAEQLRGFNPANPDVRQRNRLLSQLRNLMNEAQPIAEYSATVATAIAYSESYRFVRCEIQRHGLWSDEFASFDVGLQGIAYSN